MRSFVWIAAVGLLGCGKSHDLKIELHPDGDLLVRSVESTPEGGSLGGVHDGQFEQCYPSVFGKAWVYSELLQGNVSLAEVVARVTAASDRAVDLGLGWMRWELEELDFGASADEFEDGLRLFVKDTALALALPLASVPSVGEMPGIPLFLHHLLETGWISLAELPELYRLEYEPDEASEAHLLALLRRELAEVCGVEPDDAALAFLDSRETFEGSWRAWIRSGGGQDVPDPPDEDSEPSDALSPVFREAFSFNFFGDATRVAFELETGSEPLFTNGTFDLDTGQVSWPPVHLEPNLYRPLHRFAVWVRPDEEAQRARFGSAPLQGEELFEYALWEASLTEDERAQWTKQLARLDPGEEPFDSLDAFRFDGRPAELEEASGKAEPKPVRGAELLSDALSDALRED
jgi:hypothetical protein